MHRRAFVTSAAASTFALGLGPAFWRSATAAASTSRLGPGPYGPLGEPDANGLRLPAGFRSRVVYRAGQLVPGTAYLFPAFPDGSATYPTADGGWIHAINSELPGGTGGVSAVRYDAAGTIVSARRILGGTSTNCAGGATPWGTWLSCEEVDDGRVWECDPVGADPARELPALGTFKHEAACVDPLGEQVYLSEDLGDGCFYRFTPRDYPELDEGLLEVATVGSGGRVTWTAVPDPGAAATPTRDQVPGATRFRRGEGLWYDRGVVYLATTSDATIHAYHAAEGRMEVIYRQADVPGSPLQAVDNLTVSRSGDLFVCEDGYGNDPDALDVCVVSREGEVARFCKLTGQQHLNLGGETTSEVTGAAFSPDGTRLYFSSQRGGLTGITYEVTGPFRLDPPPARPAAQPPGTAAGPRPVADVPLGALPVEPPPAPGRPRVLLGLAVTRALRRRTLLDRGVRVRLTASERTTVELRLTMLVRDEDDGRVRRRVVASSTRRVRPGGHTLLLRVRERGSREAVRRLRGGPRRRTARLEVRAIAASGARTRSTRSVRVGLDARSRSARD